MQRTDVAQASEQSAYHRARSVLCLHVAGLREDSRQNADVYYLRAVAYARLGDKANSLKNLKVACDEEYNYKERAAVDTEFKAYWDDEEFKLIIKLW